jgi:hypothetical protein
LLYFFDFLKNTDAVLEISFFKQILSIFFVFVNQDMQFDEEFSGNESILVVFGHFETEVAPQFLLKLKEHLVDSLLLGLDASDLRLPIHHAVGQVHGDSGTPC